MLALIARVFRARTPRTVRGFAALDAGDPAEPHRYLPVLGVAPQARRVGIAEALIRPGLERCESRENADVPRNRATREPRLLRVTRIRVTEELRLAGGGPPVWRMWREPNNEQEPA